MSGVAAADGPPAQTPDSVDAILDAHGIAARPLRRVLAYLTEGPRTLEELVRLAAVPRATVESLLRAMDDDLVADRAGYRIRSARAGAYRQHFDLDAAIGSAPTTSAGFDPASHGAILQDIERLIAAAPEPRQALDHVPATAETVLRRALWLDNEYDLDGSNLLFLGDHDLTSLAISRINKRVKVTIADLDERLLAYVDTVSRERDLGIRCFFADFRFGLPTLIQAWADLVFTDPPYTVEGSRLFVARGAEALRNHEHGRIVMAYGFSARHPSLGLQVQQGIQRLGIVFEAILPAFNRYYGAQAVGSASDLYVCRPTAKTSKLLKTAYEARPNIYTHGAQSIESTRALEERVFLALRSIATGDGALPLVAHVTTGGPPPASVEQVVRLETLFRAGLPPSIARRAPFATTIDLSADQEFWLLRALLAMNAERVGILLPNNHPEVQNQRAQSGLAQLLSAKYLLRFRRSWPDRDHAVVEAKATAGPGSPAAALQHYVLSRAHGRLANVWRDGLVAVCRRSHGMQLTKNEARELVVTSTSRDLLDARLMELPRHQIAEILRALDVSASQLGRRRERL